MLSDHNDERGYLGVSRPTWKKWLGIGEQKMEHIANGGKARTNHAIYLGLYLAYRKGLPELKCDRSP